MAPGPIGKVVTELGVFMARPAAFLVVGVYAVGWFIFDKKSFDAHGIATLATWLMTLFIQRAEHRDTQAIQVKLDELLRAHGEAKNELMHIDDKEPEEIERVRKDQPPE